MTHALLRKARADLMGRPWQTALLIAVIFLSSTALSLATVIQSSASGAYERTFTEANGAHVWFHGAGDLSDYDSIRPLDGIAGVTGPHPSIGASPLVFSATDVNVSMDEENELRLIGPGGSDPALELVGMGETLPSVDRPVLADGQWLRTGNEIVLDLGTASKLDVNIGDSVEITSLSNQRPFTVVGIAASANRPPYPRIEPAMAFVLPEVLEEVQPDQSLVRWRFGVRLDEQGDTASFISKAKEMLPESSTARVSSWISVRDDFTISTIGIVLMLSLVGAMVILSVGVVIINAISSHVLSQVRDIGIMKAMGFTPGSVTGLILIEYMGLGVAAALVGLTLAMLAAPVALDRIVTQDVPITVGDVSYDPLMLTAVVFGITTLIGLMAILPAWRGGRVSTVQAITTGVAKVKDRASRVAALAARLGAPAVVVLGVKDTFNRPLRSVLSLVSLTAAVIVAIFSLGMNSTITAATDDPTLLGGTPWDVQVGIGSTDTEKHSKLQSLLESMPEVEGYSTQRSVELAAATGGHPFGSNAVSSATLEFRYFIPDGRSFQAPGEAIITQGLIEELGMNVSDEVEFLIVDSLPGQQEKLSLRIVGRYASGSGDGREITYDYETLQRQSGDSRSPDFYSVKLKSDVTVDSFRSSLSDRFGGEVSFGTFESEIDNRLRVVLLGITAGLLVIAAFAALTTAVFAVRERQKDFGILKALGMSPAQILVSVLTGSIILALVAVAIGTPVGIVVTRVLFDFFGREMGIGTGLFKMPSAPLMIVVIPAMVVVAAAGVLLPARRAASTRVAEAIRAD